MRPVNEAKQIAVRRRSSSTELHWISRSAENVAAGTNQEFAVVGPDVGDNDWAVIDPMRVRRSAGVRHYFTPAMYFWQRTRSHVWCESQAERWEVLWLDFSDQVERLWSQPMAIAFGHGSRLSGSTHVPDLLAQFADGTYGLFDVRPAALIDEPARMQFAETAAVCETVGWRYRVLTGHDTRATQNLDCLSASRHDRCLPTRQMEALILDTARGGRPRGELCQIVCPECPPLACAWVDNLAWRRLLHVDLAAVFSSETIYATANPSGERRAG
ncbi:TnsA-like heteromeric transposase endonuclease subunit [Microbacterium capsulatum]|uniref:TnsA-like heteromeric transposase endonuclease subunit n=1 Tax=Microbacterium capsulatum TaxID=3041921 RepID=A0ABU0XIT4_9MICO|nr:TnsA-like heteromeric transposase endonuclease subunit [Microbacterium sp. ASV81]MDQ4215052.1 TnsA-like heteromeric transposase endonuclease subunit [Microbacterium sp. ASV81]